MTSLEQIQALLAELGPASPDIAAVIQNGVAEWAIAFDEETVLSVEFDPRQQKLLLSINLGSPSADRRLGIYETLLTYGYLWRDTGGVYMALGGPGGEVYQMFELNAHDADIATLGNVARQLVQRAHVWREYLAETEDAQPPDASMMSISGIRV